MLGKDSIRGIYFIHIPRCGGSYLKDMLAKIADAAGIEYIYGDHSMSHRPPPGFLTISNARNPHDLLKSLYTAWDGGGFAGVGKHFSTFRDFVMYYCLATDFGFTIDDPTGWYHSVEFTHFADDEKGPVTRERVDNEDVTMQGAQLAMWSRPFPWVTTSGETADVYPYIRNINHYNLPSFINGWVRKHHVLTSYGMATWHSIREDEIESQQDIINRWWLQKFKMWGFTAREVHNYWYYNGFMWCSMYDHEKRIFLPDLVLRLENIDAGIKELCTILGVPTPDDAGIFRNRGADSGTAYVEYYSDELKQVVGDLLEPALRFFNYGFDGLLDDRPILTREDLQIHPEYSFNFIPNSDSILAEKWPLHPYIDLTGLTSFR